MLPNKYTYILIISIFAQMCWISCRNVEKSVEHDDFDEGTHDSFEASLEKNNEWDKLFSRRRRDVDGNAEKSSSLSSSESVEKFISFDKSQKDIVAAKELTDADIDKMKQDMSKELTPTQMDKFVEILQKFKEGTATKDKIEGMVELIVFAVAVRANATNTDLMKLFGENVETTTVETITENII